MSNIELFTEIEELKSKISQIRELIDLGIQLGEQQKVAELRAKLATINRQLDMFIYGETSGPAFLRAPHERS